MLKELHKKAKSIALPIGLTVLLVLTLTWGIKSCRLGDELSELKGKQEIAELQVKEAKEELVNVTKEYDTLKGNVEADRKHNEKVIDESRKEVEKYKASVVEAKKELDHLKSLPLTQESHDKIILNYEFQLSKKDDIIKEKDKQIFSLTEDYNKEHSLRLGAEVGWSKAVEWGKKQEFNYNIAKDRCGKLESSLKKARFFSGVTKAVTVALGGYILYTAVKG